MVDRDNPFYEAEFDPELNSAEGGAVGQPIEIPITDVLDLHPFRPKEVKDVVLDYLDAAYEQGLRELRIIHGKGMGVQRKTVRTLLERDPRVVEFRDGGMGGGEWGATIVLLR